jgi:DNA-binding Lrp family transcriptional regulator
MNRLDDNKTIWGYTAIVDDEKQKTKHYTVLIKRTNKPYNDDIIKKLTTIDHNQLAPETNIHILDSYYVHGSFDWILSFTSPGIKETKKFCDKLIQLYEGFISNLEIMETIVPIRKSGIKNPNIDKFAEFL